MDNHECSNKHSSIGHCASLKRPWHARHGVVGCGVCQELEQAHVPGACVKGGAYQKNGKQMKVEDEGRKTAEAWTAVMKQGQRYI
eukprot:scaffold56618_cov20-Tisochrysis_lutea.AAC.1